MSEKQPRHITRRIERIKEALRWIDPMRPGSLTRQYKDRVNETGAYWHISSSRRMKSRTDYVHGACFPEIRRPIATHKRFKRLIESDRGSEACGIATVVSLWSNTGK